MADEKMVVSKGDSPYVDSKSDPEKQVYVNDGTHRRSSVTQRTLNQLALHRIEDDESTKEGQLYSMNDVDPAMDAKMRLVNEVTIFHASLLSLKSNSLVPLVSSPNVFGPVTGLQNVRGVVTYQSRVRQSTRSAGPRSTQNCSA